MGQKANPHIINKQSKGIDKCKVPGCKNEGRYCRLHQSFKLPVVQDIEKVSEKKKELDKVYSKVRKQYLTAHPFCEAKIPDVCSKVSIEIHHKQGKVGEEDYLNPDNFLAVCRHCHNVIEKNPAFARQQGFSNSRLSSPAKNQRIQYKKAS